MADTASSFLSERDTLVVLRRQFCWVEFASALAACQMDPSYWYGALDAEAILEACDQLTGNVDSAFLDRIWRSTGRMSFPAGTRRALEKSALEALIESDATSIPYHSSWFRHTKLRTEEIYLGGEYAALPNADLIADALRKCHNIDHDRIFSDTYDALFDHQAGLVHTSTTWFTAYAWIVGLGDIDCLVPRDRLFQ